MLRKNIKLKRRKRKIRARVRGTNKVPRLSVFRSNKSIYAQLIDDEKGKTLIAVVSEDKKSAKTKLEIARETGEEIAQKAKAKKIKSVVFDRGGYKYHGRVKALAEGARKGGLKF